MRVVVCWRGEERRHEEKGEEGGEIRNVRWKAQELIALSPISFLR